MKALKTEVIICTYNGALYFGKQLDSILNQSHPVDKISIYDDNSSDETLTILKSYQKIKDNIFITQHEKRLGFNQNFEYAIKHATADFVFLSDQDDIWHQDKVKKQLQTAKQLDTTKPIMIHHDSCVINNVGQVLHPSYAKLRNYHFPKEKNLWQMMHQQGVMGHSIMINRALIEKLIPFPKSIRFYDRWITLVNEVIGTRVFIDEPLVSYRTHHNNSSNSNLRKFNITFENIFLPKFMAKKDIMLLQSLTKINDNKYNQILEKNINFIEKKLSATELYHFFKNPYLKDLSLLKKFLLFFYYYV